MIAVLGIPVAASIPGTVAASSWLDVSQHLPAPGRGKFAAFNGIFAN
jgi:hypothetical protein